MASGSYAKKSEFRASMQPGIPARATRLLPDETGESAEHMRFPAVMSLGLTVSKFQVLLQRLLEMKPLLMCMLAGMLSVFILISAVFWLRPTSPQLVSYTGGQVYAMQVGGDRATTWQQNQPQPPVKALPVSGGPYTVLSKPTLGADFINRVLASYNSPAAGKGQALYDLGVKYGIDPAFALAFFMHESSFGTQGEARISLSLGNLRCIPNYKCQDGYAWFSSWEDGFQSWYELIRNLYVSQWGRTTVDQIIPKYAPAADNNDEAAYIASLKHALDTWHAGLLQP